MSDLIQNIIQKVREVGNIYMTNQCPTEYKYKNGFNIFYLKNPFKFLFLSN